MLEKVWREGNPLTLLIGTEIVITIIKNSMGIPLKKIDLSFDPAIPLLGLYPEENMI